MTEDTEVRIEYLALQMLLIQMVGAPKDRDKQMAALELAYGNLATSRDYRPSWIRFHEIAIERYHWTEEEFGEWASDPMLTAWGP